MRLISILSIILLSSCSGFTGQYDPKTGVVKVRSIVFSPFKNRQIDIIVKDGDKYVKFGKDEEDSNRAKVIETIVDKIDLSSLVFK